MANLADPATTVIVGAGLAGLTSARVLARSGREVIVLEARDRVGGRTCSTSQGFEAGQHCDLGAELITDGYTALTRLCSELDVALSDPIWIERPDTAPGESPLEGYLAPGRVAVGGELLDGERFASVDREIRSALSTTPPSAQETCEQWVRRARLSPVARGAVVAVGRMAVQYDASQIDMHHLTHAHVGVIRRIVGGSQRLPEALANGIDVRLASPVRAIRQAGGRVQLELESGDRIAADECVVAVPAFVVPTIGFEPPLPAAQLGALTSLQRSRGGKVVGQYVEGDAVRGALTQCVFSDGHVNAAWVSNPYVTQGPAMVTGFICGTDRAVLEDGATAFAELDRLVELAVGAPVTRITGTTKNWSADPYALGLGATLPSTARSPLVANLATPERRVYFAGDYTDVPFGGTMEAAVRSGLRAASEVLRKPERLSLDRIAEMERS
jgi:monoamine oxidase